ncbi:MSMEG_0570 family nitrogen starvation response protein [Uliginosibacterium sediminicola]|uniref:MSMEG_0570 family nitrogen starvation response protein n=1 Tax=Uliginosibacterium sediminicola TaxID=2024550 RepID=A0ABU9YVC2_9RHOO
MPVMHFRVRLPDSTELNCYSPSLVIKDFLTPGTRYPMADFMSRSREALNIASERVRAKYGYACSSAMDQLAELEAHAQRFANLPDAQVEVLGFEE